MDRHQFTVTMTLKNPSASERVVTIPRGTLIEAESTHLSFQSAAISRDYVFRLRPNETRSVILDAECWNKALYAPKGVPGRITNLKGDIKRHADVWSVSSTPKAGTVLTSPSQGPNLFASLTNVAPKLALQFMDTALSKAGDDAHVQSLKAQVISLSSSLTSNPMSKRKLVDIASDPVVQPLLSAQHLRSLFITAGVSEDNMDALGKLVTDVYSHSAHKAVRSLYDFSCDMANLLEERRITLDKGRKQELLRLAQDKYIDMSDHLELLDGIG